MAAIFLSSCTVITTGQLTSGVAHAGVSQQRFSTFWTDWWWLFVKGWHATEFAVLFLLLVRWQPVSRAVFIAATWATLDEFHQTFVPMRGGRWTDVVIDCGGILAASLALAAWRATRSNGRQAMVAAQR